MANESIVRTVDDLIAKGRIQRELRDEYIRDMEAGLQNDLLRGSDYTNKTKELAQKRAEAERQIQAEYQKVQAERARLEQWQNQVQGELGKLDALPEMAAKIAAYEQALRDYQVEGKSLLDHVAVPTIPKTTNPGYQPVQPKQPEQQQGGRFMTMETAGAALRDFALLQSKVNRIQLEHQRLFGEPLYDDLIGHYLDTGEDPEQHWKIKHNVDNKRQQITQADQMAREAKIREETRAEIMKELALDPSRVTGTPLGQHQGGLTPLMEQYSQSRALAHSQNTLGGTTPPPGSTDFVPPEKRPEMAASRERVAAASRMFNEHFDLTGNPTTDKGRQLANTYKD